MNKFWNPAKILDRTLKNMGRTNTQITKFGVQLFGDQNKAVLNVISKEKLKEGIENEE